MKLTKDKGHTVPFVTFALLFDQFLLGELNGLLQIPKLNEKSPNLFQKFSQDNGILNFLNKICENTLVDFNIIAWHNCLPNVWAPRLIKIVAE